MLVSVRDEHEALLAARGGADFIDLKEPGQGALGGLPVATIRAVMAALHDASIRLPVSATIGDVPMHALEQIAQRVQAVAACGVDYVKVGIERDPGAPAVLEWLAGCGHAVVPVFIADRGLDPALVTHAASLGFPGLMADTADKHAGSLFDVTTPGELQQFITTTRAASALAGIAGALRLAHVSRLVALAPDFAGFRSAVCVGDRSSELDPQRLRVLADTMRTAQASSGRTSPISSDRIQASSVL